MRTGIDISRWQGDIDFNAAKAGGIEFCVLKAGGSNSGRYTDSKYRSFEPQVRASGMQVGHYWFNGTGNPEDDANYFVSNLAHYQPTDLLVLDIESEGSMPAWNPAQAYDFCKRVHALTGNTPILYMSSSVTRAADWSALVRMGCRLWVASYGSNSGSPEGNPSGLGAWGDEWSMWQYSSNGVIPGYSGRVDINLSKLTVQPIEPSTDKRPLTMPIYRNYQTGNIWRVFGDDWIQIPGQIDQQLAIDTWFAGTGQEKLIEITSEQEHLLRVS